STFYGLLVSASAIGTLVGTTLGANLVLQRLSVGKAFWLATALFGHRYWPYSISPQPFWFVASLVSFLSISRNNACYPKTYFTNGNS
ncbi:TPA: hypothetical protein ACK3JV_001995, partial [Streptococcus equi subsp. zooepidemicus]